MKSKKRILFLVSVLLGLGVAANAQVLCGTPPMSKIATELSKKQVASSIEIWPLESTSGTNHVEIQIEAIKYSALTGIDELKGISFRIIPNNTGSLNDFIKTSVQFEGILDQSEYPEVMVVLKQMVEDFRKKDNAKKYGSMSYITKSGLKFGYFYNDKKEYAYVSLLYSEAEITCEFSSIDKSLTDIRNQIDIASKDLYLPENAEKLKKAKKSNQEAKDVNIDDI